LNDPRALTRLCRGGPTTFHLYGAPWLQPVSISSKSDQRGSRKNTRNPLPWVATSCRRERMVRRGSTVRVRQRALAKGPQTPAFHFLGPLHLVPRDQVWNTFWNTQTRNDAVLSSFLTTDERPPTCFTYRIDLLALQYVAGMEPFMEPSGPERPLWEPCKAAVARLCSSAAAANLARW
jgi:hypothetical protein